MRTHSPFVIHVREIAHDGHACRLDLAGDFASEALAGLPLDFSAQQLAAEVSLYRTNQDIVVSGKITGALSVSCARCANPAKVELRTTIEATFVPAGRFKDDDRAKKDKEDDGEKEMPADQADVYAYTDEQVDLREPLRELLILALPYAPLCQETCKGLCTHCGHDLNEGPCSCGPEATAGDPRFAALKDVKL